MYNFIIKMYEGTNPQHHSYVPSIGERGQERNLSSEYNRILMSQAEEQRRLKQQSRILEMNMNKEYMQKEAFPFGKQSTKISNYVVNQMNKDQQNIKILQKFRLQAIKNRNQKYMSHIGTMPYLTQSMLPGVNVDASKFMDKPQLQLPPYYRTPPISKPQSLNHSPIKKYHTIDYGKRSVGVQALQQQLLKPQKKKKKHKIPYFDEEDQTLKKIKRMLKGISSKLKSNTEELNDALEESEYKKKQIYKTSRARTKFFTQNIEEEDYEEESDLKVRRPRIQYNNHKQRLKTESMKNNLRSNNELDEDKKVVRIKDHLKLLKRNRNRLDNLNKYS